MSLEDKAIKIKGKDYVQVKDRILYLAEQPEPYSINTEYTYYAERKMWVVKAVLTIGDRTYTGHAQEIESDNYRDVNHTSALENAETSAVGRACAMAGIGVLDSIASVDEIHKAENRTKPAKSPKEAALEALDAAQSPAEVSDLISRFQSSTKLTNDDKEALTFEADQKLNKLLQTI